MVVLLLGVSCFLHLVGVELEKVGDDFGFGRVGLEAVGGENGAVVRRVRGTEVGGHRQRIVEVGKRRIGIKRTRVEDGLGGSFDFLPQRTQRTAKSCRDIF